MPDLMPKVLIVDFQPGPFQFEGVYAGFEVGEALVTRGGVSTAAVVLDLGDGRAVHDCTSRVSTLNPNPLASRAVSRPSLSPPPRWTASCTSDSDASGSSHVCHSEQPWKVALLLASQHTRYSTLMTWAPGGRIRSGP